MTLDELQQQPSAFDFYQAVYSLERQFSTEQKRWQGVGRDGFPAKELVRFKAVQHLGFPGQPVTKITPRTSQASGADAGTPPAVDMHVSFIGLTGPSGVMPQHYSEMVLQRLKQRDKTMRDFFDLFNHRLVSLYYRAWEKYRFACQYEMASDNDDSFTQVLSRLSGARHALGLYYAGAFSAPQRSAQQLKQLLTDLLQTDIQILPLQGRWLSLAQSEQSALTKRSAKQGQHAALGQSAMLGSRVWDVSSSIEVQIKVQPQTAGQLLPGSYQYSLVQTLLADFLPDALRVRLSLVGQRQDFPTATLSTRHTRLGQSGCLAVRSTHQQQRCQLSYQLTAL
ncbi:MAG: type VI secretion system baseplate subunit TssG [Gammaproteobacteria bacterium]|uniref:type VI secretion system baseplate subunit TssG n=1 Tax=Rheinheimera sp. TaxID=1869214 RepID=UPI00404721A3|nr:type VI secretion system baseplate subunit TssG [Gammaproteobacteria bacterium]